MVQREERRIGLELMVWGSTSIAPVGRKEVPEAEEGILFAQRWYFPPSQSYAREICIRYVWMLCDTMGTVGIKTVLSCTAPGYNGVE